MSSNDSTFAMVGKYHRLAQQPVAMWPTPSTVEQRELRVRMLAERLLTLATTLGVQVELANVRVEHAPLGRVKHWDTPSIGITALDEGRIDVDLVGAARALGELEYDVQSANLVFGFPGPKIVAELHEHYMSRGERSVCIRDLLVKAGAGTKDVT